MPKAPQRPRFRPAMTALEDRTTPNALIVDSNFVPDRVLVTYGDASRAAPTGEIVAAAESLGHGSFAVTLTSGVSVADATTYFAGQAGVIAAEPDYYIGLQRTPNDPSYGSLWGLHNTGQSGGTADVDVDGPEAWDVSVGTRATIVAVIDTGVDFNHPDLAANMWRNDDVAGDGIDNDGNGYVDDVYGYDFANNDSNPMDDEGHGTHVAGTIGAVGNNGIGVTGVNWNTRIMALKFLDANGSGATSNAVRALNYAIDNGANISNNSWGGGGASSTLAAAINRGRTFNHIVVVAAGNNGSNNNTTSYWPANYSLSYDNVVTVASITRTGALSSFSNYGATAVTLAAPGSSILSTTPNNSYATYSGTSMATPHVAGALSLLRDQNPTWTYQQLVAKLKSSVDPLAALAGKVSTGGALNVAKMLDAGTVPPPPPPPPPPPASGDIAGPRVTTASFGGSVRGSFGSLTYAFNEPINPSTFTAADVSFTAPSGAAITITSVAVVAGTNNQQFRVTYASQSAQGTYTATIGPNISDAAGNLMNQDGDGTNGEATADRFTFTGQLGMRKTFSAAVPVAIPDLATVNIPIVVPDNIRITDLDVTIRITHTYDSDLVISLRAPNGTTRTLVNRRGGSGDNFSTTTFDDAASISVLNGAAPFNGTYRPEQTLAGFNNLASGGTWTLIVRDAAGQDVGTVHQVTLNILGSQILRLTQGVEEGDEATPVATAEASEASAKILPTPLAVWLGPVRGEEPRGQPVRRGHVRSLQSESVTPPAVETARHVTRSIPEFVPADKKHVVTLSVALNDAMSF